MHEQDKFFNINQNLNVFILLICTFFQSLLQNMFRQICPSYPWHLQTFHGIIWKSTNFRLNQICLSFIYFGLLSNLSRFEGNSLIFKKAFFGSFQEINKNELLVTGKHVLFLQIRQLGKEREPKVLSKLNYDKAPSWLCFSANITLRRGVIWNLAQSAQKFFQSARKNFKSHEAQQFFDKFWENKNLEQSSGGFASFQKRFKCFFGSNLIRF